MGRFVRIVGAASMVLTPVCFGIADEMQLVAVNNDNQVGLTAGWGEKQAVAQTESVAAHLALFQTSSWLFLAGVTGAVLLPPTPRWSTELARSASGWACPASATSVWSTEFSATARSPTNGASPRSRSPR